MQHEANRVSTTRQVATEEERGHQVPRVDHRWRIQCFCFSHAYSVTGLLAIPHKPPIPFPSQLSGAATGMGKHTRQAGSSAILPLTGPF